MPDPTDGTFRIMHNGSEWRGTFQLTVGVAIKDLLVDGPFEAILYYDNGRGGVQETIIGINDDGRLIRLGNGQGTIGVEDLLGIEIP